MAAAAGPVSRPEEASQTTSRRLASSTVRGVRLPATTVAGALALALLSGCAVRVDLPATSTTNEAACRALIDALPSRVADQQAREVTEPERAAAWGDPAITLTCAVPRPADVTATSTCLEVNGIGWAVPADQESLEAVDLTLTTIGRSPRLTLALPAEYAPPATALADLAKAVSAHTEGAGSCR